jgi:hypothetical protein
MKINVHPTSYPMGTEALSPGVKRLMNQADHSPPTGAEVKKTSIYEYTLTPHMSPWCRA